MPCPVLTVISFFVPALILGSVLINLVNVVHLAGSELTRASPRVRASFQGISKESISLLTGGGGGDLPRQISDAFTLGIAGLGVLVLTYFITGFVTTRPFASAFRLKRQLLCLADQTELTYRDCAASWFVNKSVGAYAQERLVFASVGKGNRPPERSGTS
ncbi:hypothetical protein [Streptomyces sp. NPDC049555]|uniref:hypothetical protein n=1 Tax=Streptomyces sp. NPDC049555 TaxID=3154930 RepID=UPI00342961A0